MLYGVILGVTGVMACEAGTLSSDAITKSLYCKQSSVGVASLNRLPDRGRIQINLPGGEIDLWRPVEINRSNIIIKGEGAGRTVLRTHFRKQLGEAAILIRPLADRDKVKNVQLSSFTLLQMLPETVAAAADGIVLENVAQAEIKNLDLDRSGRHGLIRRHTQDLNLTALEVIG